MNFVGTKWIHWSSGSSMDEGKYSGQSCSIIFHLSLCVLHLHLLLSQTETVSIAKRRTFFQFQKSTRQNRNKSNVIRERYVGGPCAAIYSSPIHHMPHSRLFHCWKKCTQFPWKKHAFPTFRSHQGQSTRILHGNLCA